MNNKKSNKLILFLFCLSVFVGTTNFLPPVAVISVWSLTAYLIFNAYGSVVLKRKSMALISLFFVVVIVYAIMGHGAPYSFRGHTFQILGTISLFIFSFYIVKLPKKDLNKVLYVYIVSLIISLMGTTYVSTFDAQALRVYGAGGGEELIGSQYRMLGMLSYSQAHALAILIPPLILWMFYVCKKILFFWGLILILLVFRILLVMEVTTALISTVVGCFAIFVYYITKGSWKKLTFIGTCVFLLFFFSGIFSFVWQLIGAAEDLDVAAKIASLSTIQGGEGEGDIGIRLYLYSVSFHTFLSNPIFGWGVDNGSYTKIGEHSLLLDLLAYYGLFALLLFAGWIKEYKIYRKHLGRRLNTYYMLCLTPLFILIPIKSMFAYMDYLFYSLVVVKLLFMHITKYRVLEEHGVKE